jgi:hypothetical protein
VDTILSPFYSLPIWQPISLTPTYFNIILPSSYRSSKRPAFYDVSEHISLPYLSSIPANQWLLDFITVPLALLCNFLRSGFNSRQGQWEDFFFLRHRVQTGSVAHPASYSIGKVPLCLTKHHAMEAYWGSGGTAPRILDLDTRWRWVVSFTTRPLYLQGKSTWYPLDSRLGGPQSRSGRGGKEKNSQLPPGIQP